MQCTGIFTILITNLSFNINYELMGGASGGAAAPLCPCPPQMKFKNCGVPLRHRRPTCQIRLLSEVYLIIK